MGDIELVGRGVDGNRPGYGKPGASCLRQIKKLMPYCFWIQGAIVFETHKVFHTISYRFGLRKPRS
jgi:hypothetical protein